jgi:hypothetical protein
MPVVDLYGPRAAEGGCGPGVAGTGVWEGASVWAKTKFRSTAPIIATVTMKLKQRRECCIAFSPAFGTKSIGATQLSRLAHIPYRHSDKQRARIELEFLQSRSLSLVAAALIAAILMFITPRHWHKRLWYGWIWVVPAGAIGVLAYYLAPYFRQ